MPKRAVISDYVTSLLRAETVNTCPLCVRFEGTTDQFDHHHTNLDPSVSEYWNLIRLCRACHDDLTKFREDGTRERRVRQIKKDLFRRLVGDASYQVLVMANALGTTSTLPALGISLIRLEFVRVKNSNPLTVGTAKHATIVDLEITDAGREIVRQLNIETVIPKMGK